MKKTFRLLTISLLLAIIWLLLNSCAGARKVNKESSKEETKTESIDNSTTKKQAETNTKTETKTNINDKNEITSQESIFEPIDPTKEASLVDENGKKTILNNIKKTTKTTIQKNNTATIKESLTVEIKKEAIKEQKAVKQVNTSKKENNVKNVDKKAFNPFNLLWLIIPIAIIIFLYRKYKKSAIIPFI